MVKGLVVNFQSIKLLIIEATGLDKDALHIYAGMSIYLLCLVIFRRRIHRGLLALLITTSIAILAEVLDLRDNHFALSQTALAASIHDIINTCLLPYTLYALSRWTTLLHQN